MADYGNILDQHVRPKLEDTFGKAMAMMILAAAANTTLASMFAPSKEEYIKLVDAICCDERVVGMWGSAGASDARRAWLVHAG